MLKISDSVSKFKSVIIEESIILTLSNARKSLHKISMIAENDEDKVLDDLSLRAQRINSQLDDLSLRAQRINSQLDDLSNDIKRLIFN